MHRSKFAAMAAACGLLLCAGLCAYADDVPANYIKNGGFETLNAKGFPTGWYMMDKDNPNKTVEADSTVKASGAQSLKITKTESTKEYWRAGGRVFFNDRELKPNTKYTVSFYVKMEDVKPVASYGGVSVKVWFKDAAVEYPKPPFTGTMRWQKVAHEFTTPGTEVLSKTGNCAIDIQIVYATGTVWFDDVSLVESSTLEQK